ncbi:MAG: amidohydrolase [Clostridiales bacterium]|nr:amidohydrolase [Clostridiales bacterium]
MFSQEVLALAPQVIQWRRRMHQHPELSFQEFSTTDFLKEELQKIPGLVLETPTKTGVVAVLKGTHPGRTIALRADIDALPIQEETELPFASDTRGVMHACGHDGHAAMLLAAAVLLAKKREQLWGEVRFLFQHAEELPPGGAAEMARAGVMAGVDEAYSLHLSSTFPTGTFGVRAGALTSATDRFDIRIIGKGGHSAFPETCVDPIVIAAQVITALQTVVSRRIRAVEPAVVSVCMLSAGQAYNIIPGEVDITGSTRTFDRDTREKLPAVLEQLARGICEANGGACECKFTKGYASVINDKELTRNSRQIIADTFGDGAVLEIDPLMPGEDFSSLLDHCPGFFVELGARNEETGCTVPHHNSKYRMDEDALPYGTEYLYQLVLNRLSRDAD